MRVQSEGSLARVNPRTPQGRQRKPQLLLLFSSRALPFDNSRSHSSLSLYLPSTHRLLHSCNSCCENPRSALTSLMAPSEVRKAISDSSLSPASYRALREDQKFPRDDPIAYGGHLKNKDRPYPLSLHPFQYDTNHHMIPFIRLSSFLPVARIPSTI